MYTDNCPSYAPFFSIMGCSTAIILCSLGASYGTAKSGVGAMVMGILRPEMMIKGIIPCVLSGILAIYGLVLSVLISSFARAPMTSFEGFAHFGAGLSVGMAGLAGGFSIGIVGDAGIRGCVQQPRLFVAMILILIFAEVLGLYGLIVGLLLVSKGRVAGGRC